MTFPERNTDPTTDTYPHTHQLSQNVQIKKGQDFWLLTHLKLQKNSFPFKTMPARLAYLNNYCLLFKVPFVTSMCSGENFHPMCFFFFKSDNFRAKTQLSMTLYLWTMYGKVKIQSACKGSGKRHFRLNRDTNLKLT